MTTTTTDAALAAALARLCLARDRCQEFRNALHGPLVTDLDRRREQFAWMALRFEVDELLGLYPVADPEPED